MSTFMPAAYGPVFGELFEVDRLMPLGSGRPDRAFHSKLENLNVDEAFRPQVIRDQDMAGACVAGVWLYHDFLDESHAISQKIETPTGSYWHGVMHRREGDFQNAKYWFRRVGKHPIFEPLRKAAELLATAEKGLPVSNSWDPFAFVDLCEAADSTSKQMICRQIQQREWELLFDYSYQQAIG